MQKRNLSQPLGQLDLVTINGVTFGRGTFSRLGGETSCEAPHLQYHVSGRIAVLMDDGSQMEFGPGDVSWLPPGHDTWTIGDEPAVVIDISGTGQHAKSG